MDDLTRHPDKDGNLVVRAWWLDLISGHSAETYKSWIRERGETFRARVEVATLNPVRECRGGRVEFGAGRAAAPYRSTYRSAGVSSGHCPLCGWHSRQR
jgi:hypothetical protein